MRTAKLLSTALVAPLFVASALARPGPATADGVAERLSALADPDSAIRASAERWLAAHVEPGDAEVLAGALAHGDAEVDRRLVHVLARAPRGLDLAALLRERVASTPGGAAAIAAVADDAVRERWAASGALEFPVLRGAEPMAVALELWASFGASSTIRLELTGTLADSAALLEREAHPFLGLAVEPALRARRPVTGAPRVLAGPWNRVCLALAAAYGVEAELHGLSLEATDEAPTSPAFLVFTEPGAARTSDERVLAWFRTVVLDADAAKRADAAIALVSSEWPAALEWLERRFLERNDGAVLEALLHAASTQRVVPALLDPARVRQLVALADREASGAAGGARSPRVELLLRALSTLPPIGSGGASLADAVGEGFDGASPRGRWVRLVVLEGLGAPRGAELARAVLLDGSAPAALLLQALRTAAACGGKASLAPGALARVTSACSTPEEAAELGRVVARAGVAPPEPPAAGLLPSIVALASALERGDADGGGRAWRAALASGDDPARVASVARGLRVASSTVLPSELARAWRAAREEPSRSRQRPLADAIDASAIRSGGLPTAETLEVLEAGRAAGGLAGADPDLLAVVAGLGAHPAAIQARGMLVASLRDALQGTGGASAVAPRLPPLERALDELLANGCDALADELVRSVELLRVEYRRQKEGAALLADWPPAPRLAEIDLDARARRFVPPDFGADPRSERR